MSSATVPLESAGHEETDLHQLGQDLGTDQATGQALPGGTTSDLSLDEILLLHSLGLEPADVVFGVGCASIATGQWQWSTGSVDAAHAAFHRAFDDAKEAIRHGCRTAKGVGVVGVEVEIEMSHHRAFVVVTGTAVRPIADRDSEHSFNVDYHGHPFLSDLSARDFTVLSASGWYPLDLVAGVSYVHAPRRGMGTAIGQSTQNVELTNFTETLYQAREAAMEELQSHITTAGGKGLVDAKIFDRPMPFAHHVIEFLTYGTAIKMLTKEHKHPTISLTVPLDDEVRSFEAASLSGEGVAAPEGK
jgi:uncharacterized protein YbjQ (UPF0145 family)